MWLHVFRDVVTVFWVLTVTLLEYFMEKFLCCSTSFTIFLVRDFGSVLSVSVSRFSSAFQLCFCKHESSHFLIVIILVQFVDILFYNLYVCTYLNPCQVSKCFISLKMCIINATSCFSYFSLDNSDTLLKSSWYYLMRSYF